MMLLCASVDAFERACLNGALASAASLLRGLTRIELAPKSTQLCALALRLWRQRAHPHVCGWLLCAAAEREVLHLAWLQTLGREQGAWKALVDWWTSGADEYPDASDGERG